MQMEWNFDIFSPGSSVATDGEGGSQERVDTLGKSKFSTIPHISFWPEKWTKKVLHSFLGSKKFLHGHSLDSCFTKSPWSEFNTKRGQAALSLWIHQQQNSCRHFLPNSRCLCCHCLESASEQGGGVGLMVREVRTAPTFSAPRRRRMSGGRHSVLMCVNAHRCAFNATRSPNAHIMFAWMASAWSCFDVWTISWQGHLEVLVVSELDHGHEPQIVR